MGRNEMISVIIVSYKVPQLLLRAVDALKKAHDSNREIIIVDNNSQDDSRNQVLNTFDDVKWIQNDRNLGFASAVNIGLQAASADYFLLLNPDTEIEPQALTELSEFWRNAENVGVMGGKIVNSDGSFQVQCRRRFPDPSSAFFRLFGLRHILPGHRLACSYELGSENIDEFQEVDAVSGAFMSFSRQLVCEIGMFDEGYFLMGEDLDFCYRAKQAGYKVVYYPRCVVTHHHGASRRTRPLRSIYHGHHAMMRYYRKFLSPRYSPFTSFFVYCGILSHFLGLAAVNLIQMLVKGR